MTHDRHELVWASRGAVRVTTGTTTHALSETQGLWIPAGIAHDVIIDPDALALPSWFSTVGCAVDWTRPTPLAISPDLRARLLRRHHRISIQLPVSAADDALLLALVARQALALGTPPLPRHAQARAVAQRLLGDPADTRTLSEWATVLFVDAKTLQRAFRADTGRTFSQWRTETRMVAALELLADGESVTTVAYRVGYGTAGGFINAFRREFGHTPGAAHYA